MYSRKAHDRLDKIRPFSNFRLGRAECSKEYLLRGAWRNHHFIRGPLLMMPVLSRPPSVPATTPTLSPHPSTPSTPSTLSRPFHPQEPTVLPSPYARVPSPLWKVASASAHVRSCDACDQPTYVLASEDALFRSLAGALYQRGVGRGGGGHPLPFYTLPWCEKVRDSCHLLPFSRPPPTPLPLLPTRSHCPTEKGFTAGIPPGGQRWWLRPGWRRRPRRGCPCSRLVAVPECPPQSTPCTAGPFKRRLRRAGGNKAIGGQSATMAAGGDDGAESSHAAAADGGNDEGAGRHNGIGHLCSCGAWGGGDGD